MKIKEIIVKDFGGIETQIIEPQKITCLLGKNGASKSTILTAIKRAFIGKMEPDDIRVGASKAHVTIVFDDGTSIERIRGKDRSVVKVNDKTTSQESANEFLVGKLGVPLSIYETMFGTDYFAELSKKDLTALLLSMLQVQIDYKKIIEAAESRMDTLPEAVKEYLKKMFPTGVFGLETIDEVASKVADANRAEKKILVTYTEKSKYEGEIPKDSKEELEKLLSENMQKQAEWKETQKTLQKYQMLIQQREQALKKKESIQHELESLSTVTEIPREVYEQAVSDRQKFLNASRIANQNIAAANANMQKLSRNTKIKFIYDGGVELYCEKNGGKMIPMKKVSTGEFVFVAFTLMSLISQITGTRLLVLDNLDSLDNDNLKTLIDLLQNEKQYENVFVAAVNHDDTCATIAQYDEVEIIEL